MSEAICSGCTKRLAEHEVLYTEPKIVCAKCNGKAEIARDESRSARNIKRAALSCLTFAVFGFACLTVSFALGFWPCAIISVGAGLFAGNSKISNDERFLRYLSAFDKTLIWGCTITPRCASAALPRRGNPGSSITGLGIAAFETLAMFGVIPFPPR